MLTNPVAFLSGFWRYRKSARITLVSRTKPSRYTDDELRQLYEEAERAYGAWQIEKKINTYPGLSAAELNELLRRPL